MFPIVVSSSLSANTNRRSAFLLFASVLAGATTIQAQAPAFPGALGYGSIATGGRNGTVVHVTNLNDSGSGSFRDAVNGSNRTIVFDVGGTIKLQSAVSCKSGLTILGQTAPGGIKFDGGEISFSGRNNIICRFIRVRPGSDTASDTDDAIAFANGRTMIFDHVSVEFGPWNNVDAVSTDWQNTPVTDITFQHCICADPTYDASSPPPQGFGAHTESVASDWTWCYSIFANAHNRNPLAKVNNVFINNIEYNNSAGYTTHTSTQFKHDIVNNYFVAGPASGGNFPWYQIDKNQSIYYTGNYYDGNKNGSLDGSTTTPYWYQGTGTVLTSPWSSWTSIIPTMSAQLAWRYALSTAGALPHDEVDSLLISQMKTLGSGTVGTGAGTTGPDGGLYSSQSQTGLGNNGYGTVNGLAAIPDTDNDGMADYWELATGSDPNVANPLTNTITGYTLLENYANFIAAPHAVTRTNTPVTIDLDQFTAGFSPTATFNLSSAVNGTYNLVNGTNVVFTPAADFTGLGSFIFTITDGSYALSAVVTVCITPIAPPSSATAFGGALVGASASATTTPLPANLVWRGDGVANAWNTTTANWLDGTSLAKFKNNDVVTIDDTGSNTPAIGLSGALAPNTMLFDINKDYTLAGSGSLTGTGSFSKTGSGTLTIGTTNSGMSGTISIGGGTVSLTPGTSLGSGAITLSGGATLNLSGGGGAISIPGSVTVPAGDNATITSGYTANGGYGNFISGDASSVLNLAGNQAFGGANSSQFSQFNGTIHIVSGQIRFSTSSSGNTFGSLTPNFIIDGTLWPRNAGNTIILGALNGSGFLAGPQTANTGSGSTVFQIGGKNEDAIFFGSVISNANSAGSLICFNKVGSGTQVLDGANTFGGTNGILGGTLIINGSSIASLTTVFSGATLGGTGTISGPVSVKTGGILAPGQNGVGTLTIGNNLTLSSSAVLNFDLSSSPGGANDLISLPGGVLSMSNPQIFNFNLVNNALGEGSYYLINGGINTSAAGVGFSSNLPGNTRQNFAINRPSSGNGECYVRLDVTGSAASLVWRGTNGVVWDTSTTNWANGALPDKYFNLDQVTFDDSGSNPSGITLTDTLTPAAVTVNSSKNYVFGGSGALSGGGPLTKLGSGTLTLNTTNSSYTGSILIGDGTLAANAPSCLGTGALVISNNATVTLPSSGAVFFDGTVTVPASTTGMIFSSALGNGISGNLYSGNDSSVLNLSGGVSFSGINSAQFDNFTGTINIQSGATLRYSANNSGNTYGSLSPTTIIDGTLQPRNAGNTIQLGAFSGSGALSGPQSNSGSGDTLYVVGGNNSDSTFSGNISSNTAVAGSEVLVDKIGSGTLTLSGDSTYTGGTTVESGTLSVNNASGSGTGSGDLEIFSGAMLTGSGTIGSATTIDDGAILAPGNPGGTLTFTKNLTVNDASIIQFDLGGSSDQVNVTGSLSLGGQLMISNTTGFGPGTYTLFSSVGAIDFGNLTLASTPTGYNCSLDTNTTGVVKLVVAPPPSISGVGLSNNGNIVFSGSGGIPNGTYYVITSTNIETPMVSWKIIQTNQFDDSGNFSVTNGPATNAASFYRLKLQ